MMGDPSDIGALTLAVDARMGLSRHDFDKGEKR